MSKETEETIYKNYLEQCISIKNDIYALLASLHKSSTQRRDEYTNEANKMVEILKPLINESEVILKEFKELEDHMKKSLKKEFIKLQEQYEMGTIYINTITKRMDDLESYIKNERFHNIVKDINDLEDKFEEEAIKLVQSRMREKK